MEDAPTSGSYAANGCRVTWSGKTEAGTPAGIIHFRDGDWFDPQGRVGHHMRSGALTVSGPCKIRGRDDVLREFRADYNEPQPLGLPVEAQEESRSGIFSRFTT